VEVDLLIALAECEEMDPKLTSSKRPDATSDDGTSRTWRASLTESAAAVHCGLL
jgi:hypothetical protein